MADPFTPKFVDLVRNFTSTPGTGNLVLGEAAPGFTSFTSALQPGDQFYYSVVGLTKTEESEVGRGTLLADGSIAREPIGGAATDFSSGSKTVALVAAAEWFQSIEAVRGAPAQVATRAAMAALNPSGAALLGEAGREGLFLFDGGDLSAKVSGDPAQGFHVAPGSDVTGASGAWVRIATKATPFMFGAVGNGATNDLAALQAFNDFVFAQLRDMHADWSGHFAIGGKLVIGPGEATSNNGERYKVGGDLHLTQLVPTFESVRIRHLQMVNWHGRISVKGIGHRSFASRSCGIGIYLESCSMARFTGGLRAFNFWLQGVCAEGAGSSNIAAHLGLVRCYDCGSGQEGAISGQLGDGLTAGWSAPMNSTVSGKQQTTLTLDAFPDEDIEVLGPIGDQQLHVRIGNYLYYVYAIDRTAGTVGIYPWIDPALGTTGKLEWVFGGGLTTTGLDGGIVIVDHMHTIRCGKGLSVQSLYGPRVNSANVSNGGVGTMIGKNPSAACGGTSIDAHYTEGNAEDIVFAMTTGSGNNYATINSSYELNLAKVWAIGDGNRDPVTGLIGSTTIGADIPGPRIQLTQNGRTLSFHGPQLGAMRSTTNTFRGQRQPPGTYTQFRDGQTVTLEKQGTGEFNRLFGYTGGSWRFVGSGTNGAPTGSFTFVPPSGGTVNGGATAAFSDFTGPADFEINHTDAEQLTWQVRCVAGQQAMSGAVSASGLTVSGADKLLGSVNGSGAITEISCTSAGRAILDDASAAAQRATLGLAAIAASGSGADLSSASVAYAKIQPVSATDTLLGRSSAGAGTIEEISCTAAGRALIGGASAAEQRQTIEVVRGIGFHCAGLPAPSEAIGGVIAPYGFSAAAANSACKALVAATAATSVAIRRNGTQIGTFDFAAGTTAATATFTDTNVAAGDQITFHAPINGDATLADIDGLVRE